MRKAGLIMGLMFLIAFVALIGGCGSKQVKKDEDFSAEKFMAKAVKLMDDREYEEARKVLVEVRNRDITKKYAPLAQLKIADTYVRDGDPNTGIEEYKKFLDLYPDSPQASYAQYQIAMAYFTQIGSADRGLSAAQKALQEFIRLKEVYPRNPYREIITLRIDKCKDIMAKGEFMIGEFYFKKESYNAAIKRFEGLLKEFPAFEGADETLLLLGKSYKALKMTDKAREAFNSLLEKYPSSKFVKEAKKGIP